MPIRREQIAGQMHILASADDRINHLHNADEERRRIKAIREKGHDLVRLYNQFLIAANGDLAELPKSEKERNEVVAAMGTFETGWTSFRLDSTSTRRRKTSHSGHGLIALYSALLGSSP